MTKYEKKLTNEFIEDIIISLEFQSKDDVLNLLEAMASYTNQLNDDTLALSNASIEIISEIDKYTTLSNNYASHNRKAESDRLKYIAEGLTLGFNIFKKYLKSK